MGRNKLWSEDMGARFPEGTFAKIEREREADESRTDFVRAAVIAEIDRRRIERLARPKTAMAKKVVKTAKAKPAKKRRPLERPRGRRG